MKYMRILYMALLCFPLLISCEMKKDIFGEEPEIEAPSYDNIGMLDLQLEAEKEAPLPGTKVPEEEEILDTESFSIEIADSVGQTVKRYASYKEMKEDEELLLPVGKYIIRVSYGDDPDAGFNTPYYEADTTCVITEKEVARVVAKCRLANKKVQFLFTENFLNQFNEDYYVVVDNGVGVLTLTQEELRTAYFRNTGTLRFTLYGTTRDSKVFSYTHDMSSDESIKEHNNVLIELDAVPSIPEGEEPELPDDPEDEEPELPEDPEEPTDPEETPEYPADAPVIKVDVSLIEKDYVIEIPSDFVETDKPDLPGGEEDTPGEDTPGDGDSQKVKLTGKIDGKTFNVNSSQTLSDKTKSVVINLYLPTGLDVLTVDVKIGLEADPIELTLDLLDASAVADINNTVLSDMGKQLVVPAKGDKGNLTFDISPFLGMIGKENSFKVYVKDKNGDDETVTLKLLKK